MIAILWRYTVRPEARVPFERAYGPRGDWAVLFSRGQGYLGTELYRGDDHQFLTIDRWRRREDFEAFMAAYAEPYRALDEKTADWTIEESRIGLWEGAGPLFAVR